MLRVESVYRAELRLSFDRIAQICSTSSGRPRWNKISKSPQCSKADIDTFPVLFRFNSLHQQPLSSGDQVEKSVTLPIIPWLPSYCSRAGRPLAAHPFFFLFDVAAFNNFNYWHFNADPLSLSLTISSSFVNCLLATANYLIW